MAFTRLFQGVVLQSSCNELSKGRVLMIQKLTVQGGCHCGNVRFEAQINRTSEVQVCNCSMCSMCGFQHLIVSADNFQLMSDETSLSEYQFRSKTARHFFCSTCGVKSFYVPRSNPDGFSLNVRCLELTDDCELIYSDFDGRNWSAHAGKLACLSK